MTSRGGPPRPRSPEDAGTHEIKGREYPVHAWSALRVVAGAGGARRSVGLEAPLVGRERELELILAASDATAADVCARLVTIVGEADRGSPVCYGSSSSTSMGSRRWRWWHQGRCLSWAGRSGRSSLADMVGARAGILSWRGGGAGLGASEARSAAVEQHVPDDREWRLVEPRLAHLLGLSRERRPIARICSRGGGIVLRADGGDRAGDPGLRGSGNGRISAACSISLTTCSNGLPSL